MREAIEGVLEKRSAGPGSTQTPLVAIGHSKDLVDFEAVGRILEYLKQNGVAVTTFSRLLSREPRLSSEALCRACRVLNRPRTGRVERSGQNPSRFDGIPSLPVFAKEEFLRAVGDEYGWLGGIDESGILRCVLPYTIVRKAGLRMVRFRVETISLGGPLDVPEEQSFLNSVVQHFRTTRADVIIPPTNNAIFRTYPDGASRSSVRQLCD